MSDRRTELGFERTVCDCGACKINCKFIPGFLLPSDISRIVEHLGYSNPVEFALDNLLASPGAIVMDHGQIRRIPTLAPARRQDGACLFLDEEDRCRIHSVSPYGCSHFDAHQTKEEADLRSSAGHYQVDLAWKKDHLYALLWLLLKALGRIAPSPIDARARMRAALAAGEYGGEDISEIKHKGLSKNNLTICRKIFENISKSSESQIEIRQVIFGQTLSDEKSVGRII